MKVLISGANGFLGQHLRSLLAQQKYEVYGLVRDPSCSEDHPYDFAKDLPLPSLKGYDAVVHLAALVHKKSSDAKKTEFERVNHIGTQLLAQKAIKDGVKHFIFISSVSVYGESPKNQPLTLQTPTNPESPYAQSKRNAEKTLFQICEDHSMKLTIIRPPLIYGKEAPGNFSTLAKAVKLRLPLPLGSVSNKRSFVSVFNLCDFILHCLRKPDACQGTFLISDPNTVSTKEFITAIGNALHIKPNLFNFPSQLLYFAFAILKKEDLAKKIMGDFEIDITETCHKTGWVPRFDLETSLQNAYNRGHRV